MSDFLQPHGLQPTRLLCLWNSPEKNTGVGCHSLLQGIFPTQGSNLSLHHLHLAGGIFPTSTSWETQTKPSAMVFQRVISLWEGSRHPRLTCENVVHYVSQKHSDLALRPGNIGIWQKKKKNIYIYICIATIIFFKHFGPGKVHFFLKCVFLQF